MQKQLNPKETLTVMVIWRHLRSWCTFLLLHLQVSCLMCYHHLLFLGAIFKLPKPLSVVRCFLILVCLWHGKKLQKATLSDEHGESWEGDWKLCRSCWVIVLAKWGEVRGNLCLSWQPGTVTMAQIAQAQRKVQQTAGRRGKERGRDWGNADPAAFVPIPIPGSRPRLPKSQHAIRDTDGLLLGGCGCNRDLRAAQQPAFCAYRKIQHMGWLN